MVGNNWQPADPEVARLKDRLTAVELALAGRISTLETEGRARWQRAEQAQVRGRERRWQITLAVVSGLVLPVAVVGVLALLHLAG